jgi:hypothetical protein
MSGFHPVNNPNIPKKHQTQLQISKQTQDNIRILDCTLRTMSTAENLCNIKYKLKKYNIDKKDVSSFKTFEQIRDDFLMNIQCLNTMVQLFKKRHQSKKPIILPPYDKRILKYDLNAFRMIATLKNPELDKYFNDFDNLIDGNNIESYPEKDMLTSSKNEEQVDEEKINIFAETIINQAEKERKKLENLVENYCETGQVNLSNDADED